MTKLDRELILCKYRPIYFITNYCYTLDPKSEIKIKKIPKWDYIIKLIENIHNNQNNLIEKSRQMLVSWVSQAYNVWGLCFGSGYAALNLSRKEDFVDDGTHNSLFGKIRFIFDRLPRWMIEDCFGENASSNKFIRFLNARNEKRNNSIIGESANVSSGRGGSYTKVFADEFGFIDKSESVYSSFDEACEFGKNLITTPPFKGKKCAFYRLRKDCLEKKNNFKLIRIHWTEHPDKDKTWYEEACRGKTDDEIARELDIDWNVSVKGRIYERWDSNKHVIEYQYQKELPLDIDFDFGIGSTSPVSIGFSQDLPDGSIVYLKDLEFHGKSVDEIAPDIIDSLFELKVINNTEVEKEFKLINRIDKRIEYVKESNIFAFIKSPINVRCFGDPTGKAKGATGKSWISEFAKYGFMIQYTFNPKKRDLEYGHLLVNRQIIDNKLLCTQDCTLTIDSLENYKRKTDSEGNVLDSMTVENNWAKHRCDGIRYKIINTRTLKEKIDNKEMRRRLRRLPTGF